jgi:hypothetical protein
VNVVSWKPLAGGGVELVVSVGMAMGVVVSRPDRSTVSDPKIPPVSGLIAFRVRFE